MENKVGPGAVRESSSRVSHTDIAVSASPQSSATKAPRRFVRQLIPDSILKDPALKAAMAVLPSNYNLEIPKCIWRIKQAGAKRVALQFPEGLLMYSLTICDILETFTDVEECFVLGDVTYGACCVDDFSAAALGADFLIHYGHSCLVPIDFTSIPCLYVFVDIQIDVQHLVDTIKYNFKSEDKIALAGTIQFSTAIHAAKAALADQHPNIVVPQAKPLSPGEVLGCTAPSLPRETVDSVVFVADGRFHLEAFMIANPQVDAFRYDPYLKILILEKYDHKSMKETRKRAILQAQRGKQWGIILGTLGRQGNPKVLNHIEQQFTEKDLSYTIFLMSEISPSKIALFEGSIDAWVQIACPRLSIDWGDAFTQPLLTPFEADVALGFVQPWWDKEIEWENTCRNMAELQVSSCGSSEDVRADDTSCSKDSCCAGKCSLDGDKSAKDIAKTDKEAIDVPDRILESAVYPMDYYARDGGHWSSAYIQKSAAQRKSVLDKSSTNNCYTASEQADRQQTMYIVR
eukprot:Gb_23501 [translate_table: standard]